jgi:uracil-DNA glycosylase
MDVRIEQQWKEQLAEEFEKDYFRQLTDFVRQEYRQGRV